jgi:hypothetical protein
MRYLFTPTHYNHLALFFIEQRWRLLIWSTFAFILFIFLETQIEDSTPNLLIWVALFILFSALQALVLSSFIFFFQNLASIKAQKGMLYRFYCFIEWCEAIIFTLLVPFPVFIFLYAIYIKI